MEMFEALEIFSSLSQETRLRIFKFLLEYGRDGAMAGTVAEQLEIPNNTLSFHLSHMSKAGLVTSKKEGRTVTYFANVGAVEGVIEYLQENCCVREQRPKSKKSINERKC